MSSREVVLDIINSVAGIEFVEFVSTEPVPIAMWKLVASHDSPPWLVANDLVDCVEPWRLLCERLGLLDEQEAALLSIGGLADAPWARIHCGRPEDLLRHALPRPDEPEFIMMSPCRTKIAAITTEEQGYYIFGGERDKETWRMWRAGT